MHRDSTLSAYKEGEFGADFNGQRYHSTIRSTKCMLLSKEVRCHHCKLYRYNLNTMLRRRQEQKEQSVQPPPIISLVHSRKRHADMNTEQIVSKYHALQQEKREVLLQNKVLLTENDRLKREIKEKIRTQGSTLTDIDSLDLMNVVAEISESNEYQKCSDYQKLLIDQQLKYNKLTDKRGMRWHPTIIKWCIYLRRKSPKGYKSLKESGFLSLHSQRTLYDYSHCVKGRLYKISTDKGRWVLFVGEYMGMVL